MKYLRSFNENTNNDIDTICEKYNIEHYTINDDGTIDVDGNVDLSNKKLVDLPLKFRNVRGDFLCAENKLKSLEGAPQNVGGYFNCSINNLTSLEGGPKYVGGYFYCYTNQLTTLKGAPQSVGVIFYCGNNKLKNIDYLPNRYGKLNINENPIFIILKLFTNPDSYNWIKSNNDKELIMDFNDREITQNDILILNRLVEFLEDVNKPQTKEYLQNLLENEYEIR